MFGIGVHACPNLCREINDRFPARERNIGGVTLEVKNWTVFHPLYKGRKVCDDVSLNIRKGEVVGISGLMGAGRTELVKSIFGRSYGTDISGELYLNGARVNFKTVSDAILQTEGLVKNYGGRRVVNGVDLQIRPGEVVGVLGPNGAGKTTTFRMVMGIIPCRTGSVRFAEQDITRLPMFRRARLGMGYLLQEESIFQMTVEDNIYAILETQPLTRRERQDRMQELLADLNLSRLAKNHAGTLSGGERRRLEICRALVTNPRILLLDEPFYGIDPKTCEDIQKIVAQLQRRGMSILLTDHNVFETFTIVDRAYIIHDGHILKHGTPAELVEDPEARRIYLGDKFAEYGDSFRHLREEIERKDLLLEHYIEQFKLAQQRKFGTSSERTEVPDQISLFNEAEAAADGGAAEPAELERIEYTRRKRKGKREEFYAGVPVKTVVHELPEEERACPKCGRPMRECGREVVRCELEHIPASVAKVEHVQVIYDCAGCAGDPGAEKRTIVRSGVPAPVVPNSGIASPSLVAYVVSSKYSLALPLHRQAEEFRRLGIGIPKQNLANWVIFVSNRWLSEIWELLKDELLRNEIIHADETTHQVINEEGRRASQRSYLWGYFTGRDATRQVALFEYRETRAKEHPLRLLEGFAGKVHVDAYAGYLALELQGVILSYCWSHCRRPFFEVVKALPKDKRGRYTASVGVRYCDHLFALERYYDGEGFTREQRERWRELLSIPLAEEFFAWAEATLPNVNAKSKLGQALSYALNNRRRLMNVFLDGRLELSNNRAERGQRGHAIGRNNWKFSYSPEGATASAIAYSIVETALANGLVPYLYLNYLFEAMPNIPKERYGECLPWSPQVQMLCAVLKPADKAEM